MTFIIITFTTHFSKSRMQTESENLVTKISSNVFYKEFTFHKNDFITTDGQKELADNVLWIDDLLFIIQIKERNSTDVKTVVEENKWFENTILKKAKNQIKDSLNFFSLYDEIKVKNVRNHVIDIAKANATSIHKIIIYQPNSTLLNDKNKSLKFCNSSVVGNIHLFNIEDYLGICEILITPAELDEYLKFRERIFLKHPEIITLYPEQYILGHFLVTDDISLINPEYIQSFSKLQSDFNQFDMSAMLENFIDKISIESDKNPNVYYPIIKEIAKLNRTELAMFKERYSKMINHVKENSFSVPYRFMISRTGCGFVFVPLMLDVASLWENALLNSIDVYKYKRNLVKCLGVSAYKDGEYYNLNWGFVEHEWEHNDELEQALKQEEGFYGNGEIKEFERYKFKS